MFPLALAPSYDVRWYAWEIDLMADQEKSVIASAKLRLVRGWLAHKHLCWQWRQPPYIMSLDIYTNFRKSRNARLTRDKMLLEQLLRLSAWWNIIVCQAIRRT